jgi:hypothetical protein
MSENVPTMPQLQDLNDPLLKRMIEEVRFFVRDYPELNRLTAGLDHSNRHIFWAILDTSSDWASTPPFIGQDLRMVAEKGWWSVFLRGVVITLLESLGILHMRNHLSYSDGGVNVQTENPAMIQAWLQMFKNEYEQKKQRILIAQNIANALDGGGVHSELVYVNSFWGAW